MKLANLLKSGASAISFGGDAPVVRAKRPQHIVTSTVGRRGAPYRKIIKYERDGPFYRQVGASPDGRPILQTYYRHRFLHATKGWRVNSHVPMAMGRVR